MADILLKIPTHGANLASGIQEARLFETKAGRLELSQGDYQAIIAAEANLIHYYKMDNTWNDSKGTNHGTATGATFGTAIFGAASGNFDGNDYVALGTPIQAFMGTGNYTVEVYGKLTSAAAQDLLSTAVDGDHEARMAIDAAGKPQFITYEGGYSNVVGTIAVNDNLPHQLVFVKVGTTGYIYIDGVLNVSGTIKNVVGTANWLTIGVHRWGAANFSEYYNGIMDELSIYNTDLSATVIAYHYNRYSQGSPAATLLKIGDAAGKKFKPLGSGLWIPENIGISGSPQAPKYQYALLVGYADSPSYNGTWLTQAALRTAIGERTNTVEAIMLQSQFPSNGGAQCSIDDGFIPAELVAGGNISTLID